MSESTITVEQVVSDFHVFQEFSDDHVNEAIKRAQAQVASDQLSDEAELATILYARHCLLNDWESSWGGVQSASTFGNSQTMKDYGGYDRFIQDYDGLVAKYGASEDLGEAWTE